MSGHFEDLFASRNSRRDNYLSRVFAIFAEDVTRYWARCPRSPYDCLPDRPTLRATDEPVFATLDFALRSCADGRLFIAEQKAELAYESYRYLRLDVLDPADPDQLAHHAQKRAFRWFLEVARDPTSHPVFVRAKPVAVHGAILVWGAITPSGREA